MVVTEPAPWPDAVSEPAADAFAGPEYAADDAECDRRHATPAFPRQDDDAVANPGPAPAAAVVAHQPLPEQVERAAARFPGASADARLLAAQFSPAQ